MTPSAYEMNTHRTPMPNGVLIDVFPRGFDVSLHERNDDDDEAIGIYAKYGHTVGCQCCKLGETDHTRVR